MGVWSGMVLGPRLVGVVFGSLWLLNASPIRHPHFAGLYYGIRKGYATKILSCVVWCWWWECVLVGCCCSCANELPRRLLLPLVCNPPSQVTRHWRDWLRHRLHLWHWYAPPLTPCVCCVCVGGWVAGVTCSDNLAAVSNRVDWLSTTFCNFSFLSFC